MRRCFSSIDSLNLIEQGSVSVDSTNDNSIKNELNSNPDLSSQVKDKIFNKVYFYIIVSFLLFNWQEIIILLKAKEDVYYTLAIIFTGKTFFGGIFLPAWLAHFGLPIITGLLASILSPYITFAVLYLTSDCFAKIRHGDRIADQKVLGMLASARRALAKQDAEINSLEQRNLDLKKNNDALMSKNNELLERRREVFFGIKAFVDCYDEKEGLHNEADVIAFLKEVEHTEFYKDDAIRIKMPMLIEDLKRIYLEGATLAEDNNEKRPITAKLVFALMQVIIRLLRRML